MLNCNYAETLFNFLYNDINGYNVSSAARTKFLGDVSTLLYGEVPFQTCKEIIEKANAKKDSVFFDLGSGTGRVVMEAFLLTDFRKTIGVELLDGLHDKAMEVKAVFDKNIKPEISEHIVGRELNFIHGDIFKIDYSEADFIFMNHPLKDSDLFLQLEEKLLNELKPGTKIVTIIRALRNPKFKSLGSQLYKFSWGDSTAHFFEV